MSVHAHGGLTEVGALLEGMGQAAVRAAAQLALAPTAQKNVALAGAAGAVRARQSGLLAANKADLDAARDAGLAGALIDRLRLDPRRLEGIARSLEEIVALPDPVGSI